jgi:hypothetical protein
MIGIQALSRAGECLLIYILCRFEKGTVAKDYAPLARFKPSCFFAFVCLLLGEYYSSCKRTSAVLLSP